VRAVRARRDAARARATLDAVRRACEGDDNLFPHVLEAVRSEVTLGEICQVLREVFGEHRDPAHQKGGLRLGVRAKKSLVGTTREPMRRGPDRESARVTSLPGTALINVQSACQQVTLEDPRVCWLQA